MELPERQVVLVRLQFTASEKTAYDELQRSSMAQIKVALRPALSPSLLILKVMSS